MVETRAVNVGEAEIITALEQFRGDILQVPTMFSALKHNGKPLYEYARQGITVEREARPITIFEIAFYRICRTLSYVRGTLLERHLYSYFSR
ncbi:tRNA pseudouridine synthase B [Actinobacillus pleuropneumoniae]|nr:tRNA pseudouridine synthase B [Actinobacillus pleuropneumoniae]